MTLRTALLWGGGVVLLCGTLFLLPLVVTSVVLGITMLVAPAVWSIGAVYARNEQQAFFCGGVICGIMPLVAALFVAACLIGAGFFPPIYRPVPKNIGYLSGTKPPVRTVRPPPVLTFAETIPLRLVLGGIWLAPQLFSLLGGGLSCLTYRIAKPAAERQITAEPRYVRSLDAGIALQTPPGKWQRSKGCAQSQPSKLS